MAGRRSDTRERIQQVALELFIDQGYEKTSLREIAERLNVTKAALYYHFRTKEDIVRSLTDDFSASLDELLAWGPGRPLVDILRRFADLVGGQFGPVMAFMQANQNAMKDLDVHSGFPDKMKALFHLVGSDEDDPATQLRSRLALVAILVGNSPMFLRETGTETSSEVALEVALELASPRSGPSGPAT
jgi:AcrR family transcriptional regulator